MRSHQPSLKHFVARGLLALTFLFAQQTAALHWLSHAIEATQQKPVKGALPGDHCDECLTLGALGAGATSPGVVLPIPNAHYALFAATDAVAAPAPIRLAFRSRAPPTLA